MGQNNSINKINFESVQNIINKNTKELFIIISTLKEENQDCLIKGTTLPKKEIELINYYLKENKKINILIYGENCSDENVVNKYNQLNQLGFSNIYIYIGGLFEWLLLQDVFGNEEFPTTNTILDILKYKGKQIL